MAELPWWSKLLLYGGVAVGGVWVLSVAVSNLLWGGVNTYKEMWTKQYNELLQKMANYTKTNPTGWTEAQKINVNTEEKILDSTAQGLANANNGVYNMIEIVTAELTVIGVSAAIIYKVINKYISQSGGKIRTSAGANYVAIEAFAEQMAANGYPLEATNLMNTAISLFDAIDAPYMETSIVNITATLPALSGIQLIIAQQQIEALNVELAIIRTFLQVVFP